MHTPAPPVDQNPLSMCPPPGSPCKRKQGGFSLIEVTLAIAIVAFAFISLIGLLPAGLSVFNQTMDSTNEMRITSDLSSMIQASDYDKLTSDFANNIYYFDVDGGALDTKQRENEGYREQRIYSAKVVFDDQYVQPSTLKYARDTVALRALILIGKYNETVNDKLEDISTAQDVLELLKKPVRSHKIRVFPMVITKTDGLNRIP